MERLMPTVTNRVREAVVTSYAYVADGYSGLQVIAPCDVTVVSCSHDLRVRSFATVRILSILRLRWSTLSLRMASLVAIFNVKGQRIRTLVNEDKIKGEYEIIWDGKDISENDITNGIYIVRFQCGKKFYSGKIIILK